MTELLKTATALGLDPEAVAAGGLVAIRALIALKRASETGQGAPRAALLVRVQDALRALDPAVHSDLVNQVQARVVALQGRSGDTEIAHVTPGEIVLPKELQTSAVLGALRRAAEDAGVPLDRLRVGSGENKVNPETRAAEFAEEDAPEIRIEARRPEVDHERDVRDLSLLIFGEGASEWDKEGVMEHIGWTAVNRVGAPSFKNSIPAVIRMANAYYAYNGPLWRKAETAPDKLEPLNAKAFQRAQAVARGILEGRIPDPTGGAQYFYTGKTPEWFAKRMASGRLSPIERKFDNLTVLRDTNPPRRR
ncbi:MAG: cell wall hydrolase [Rhodospirillaceae bacterium]